MNNSPAPTLPPAAAGLSVSGHETDMLMLSLRAAVALVLVLVLIFLTRLVLARLQQGGLAGGRVRRLGITEQMVIDGRHRLLLIRRDDVEHLVLLGPEQARIIETGIPLSSLPITQDPSI